MSYVVDRDDIKERWHQFNFASEKLREALGDAEYNSTFTQTQVFQCKYLRAQLKVDMYKICKEINEVLKGEE